MSSGEGPVKRTKPYSMLRGAILGEAETQMDYNSLRENYPNETAQDKRDRSKILEITHEEGQHQKEFTGMLENRATSEPKKNGATPVKEKEDKRDPVTRAVFKFLED